MSMIAPEHRPKYMVSASCDVNLERKAWQHPQCGQFYVEGGFYTNHIGRCNGPPSDRKRANDQVEGKRREIPRKRQRVGDDGEVRTNYALTASDEESDDNAEPSEDASSSSEDYNFEEEEEEEDASSQGDAEVDEASASAAPLPAVGAADPDNVASRESSDGKRPNPIRAALISQIGPSPAPLAGTGGRTLSRPLIGVATQRVITMAPQTVMLLPTDDAAPAVQGVTHTVDVVAAAVSSTPSAAATMDASVAQTQLVLPGRLEIEQRMAVHSPMVRVAYSLTRADENTFFELVATADQEMASVTQSVKDALAPSLSELRNVQAQITDLNPDILTARQVANEREERALKPLAPKVINMIAGAIRDDFVVHSSGPGEAAPRDLDVSALATAKEIWDKKTHDPRVATDFKTLQALRVREADLMDLVGPLVPLIKAVQARDAFADAHNISKETLEAVRRCYQFKLH